MRHYQIDKAAGCTPLRHYWEVCVGSCHAYTALREDYRQQLTKIHSEAGFQYVRFHGLLDDDMSVVFRDRQGNLIYNFSNIDSIFDFLLRIGMKPFVEIGFMPTALASTPTTCFHYQGNVSQPKEYVQWQKLMKMLLLHFRQRYGAAEIRTWFFEVWNEPNLKFFYEGTQEDYFTLYTHTVNAIKEVDSNLRVGGPATACNAWITDLIQYCEKNQVPLDFISTHHYPTDDPLWESGLSVDTAMMQLFESQRSEAQKAQQSYKRDILRQMTEAAKKEAGDYPLYYTEWNSSAIFPDSVHDLPYSGALIAKAVIDNINLVEAYSFWTFTDIFEENGQFPGEFHGGFGLQTVHGIPKATYRVFQLLHFLGDQKFSEIPEQGTVGMTVSLNHTEVRIIAYNYAPLQSPIQEEQVQITLNNSQVSAAEIIYVDETHANSYASWKDMGAPIDPTEEQLEKLQNASKLHSERLKVEKTNNGAAVSFKLIPYAVAFLRIW